MQKNNDKVITFISQSRGEMPSPVILNYEKLLEFGEQIDAILLELKNQQNRDKTEG